MRKSLNKGLMDNYFKFKEIKQNYLGYSKRGNNGSGLGEKFAKSLYYNLKEIFNNFGEEKITQASHIEKLCLFDTGVGRDNISDFIVNVIKRFFLEYTEKFAKKYIIPQKLRTSMIRRAVFDHKKKVWMPRQYVLPYHNNDFVLLTPKKILTKDDNWINRSDMLSGFHEITDSITDEMLRNQVNTLYKSLLADDGIERTNKEQQERKKHAIQAIIADYPTFLDYYIRYKENDRDEAKEISKVKVMDTERVFIENIRRLLGILREKTEYLKTNVDSYSEAMMRVGYLKKVIEDNGGYKLFYHNGVPVKRENDLQIMFRFVWCSSEYDFNSEVNNGRGPVDFKVSKGSIDKAIIEFKLASNTKIKLHLENQVAIYKAANDTEKAIILIMFFSEKEEHKIKTLIKSLGLDKDENVVLVDARSDNKPSASVA